VGELADNVFLDPVKSLVVFVEWWLQTIQASHHDGNQLWQSKLIDVRGCQHSSAQQSHW
jgi:hypothetical protein